MISKLALCMASANKLESEFNSNNKNTFPKVYTKRERWMGAGKHSLQHWRLSNRQWWDS